MACWYFCSLCRDGAERSTSAELLEHILKYHKCNGWTKYNGHPKKKCLIKFHFDLMNPQERICTSLKSVSLQCSICKTHHNWSVDYVACVQRHVEDDKNSQMFREEFPSQDDEFLLNAAENMANQADEQISSSVLNLNDQSEMLSQDDLILAMHEELLLQHSQDTVQKLLNGKFKKYMAHYCSDVH